MLGGQLGDAGGIWQDSRFVVCKSEISLLLLCHPGGSRGPVLSRCSEPEFSGQTATCFSQTRIQCGAWNHFRSLGEHFLHGCDAYLFWRQVQLESANHFIFSQQLRWLFSVVLDGREGIGEQLLLQPFRILGDDDE